MIVLGIDPGFRNVGIGVLSLARASMRVVHHETYRTSARDDAEARLDAIADHLMDLVDEYRPTVIGYENQAHVSAGIARDDEAEGLRRSTIAARRVHEVVGAIRTVARCYGLPCYSFAPATIKVAVLGKGGGRASKDRVKDAVRTIFRVAAGSEHAADALAAAVATSRRHRAELASAAGARALIH